MNDAFGRQIKPVDNIVWANRQSSSMWLSRGIVLDVSEKAIVVERVWPEPIRRVTLKRGNLIAVTGNT